MVFPIVVVAINGLRGCIDTGKHARKGDPEFYRVVSLNQELQDSGRISMRIDNGKNNDETTIFFIYRDDMSPETWSSLTELEKLLGLRPGGNDFKVNYGILPETDQEIALQTRSLLQMMVILASQMTYHQSISQTVARLPPCFNPTARKNQWDSSSRCTPLPVNPMMSMFPRGIGIIGFGSTIETLLQSGSLPF